MESTQITAQLDIQSDERRHGYWEERFGDTAKENAEVVFSMTEVKRQYNRLAKLAAKAGLTISQGLITDTGFGSGYADHTVAVNFTGEADEVEKFIFSKPVFTAYFKDRYEDEETLANERANIMLYAAHPKYVAAQSEQNEQARVIARPAVQSLREALTQAELSLRGFDDILGYGIDRVVTEELTKILQSIDRISRVTTVTKPRYERK